MSRHTMIRTLECRFFTGLLLLTGAWCHAAVTGELRQSVHPVLVRKTHNPVWSVVLKRDHPGDVRLKRVTVALEGSTPVEVVERVELFATGPEAMFSTGRPLATLEPTTRRLAFEINQPLAADQEHLWLSVSLRPDAPLTTQLAVRCVALETTAGPVSLTGAQTLVPHHLGVALRQAGEDGVHTSRIPALATSPRGTLLCVYDVRRRAGRDLQEDIDIGLSRSVDGGATWEPLAIIMDQGTFNGLPQEQNGCSDPGIIVDQRTGEIFVFAVWMWGKPGKHQWNGDGSEPGYELGKTAQLLMVRSTDDGRSWSAPVNLTRVLKQEAWWLLAPAPQQGLQLADGTLVMPMQGRDHEGVPFATIMTSADHGETWTLGNPADRESNECQAAVLGDGAIMLNMRNDRERFRAVAVTHDLGRTWTPHPTNRNTLIEPNCNGSLYRVDYDEAGEARHVLLFANPQTQQTRTRHTIQVSFDDGLTWPRSHHRLLDEGRGAGYPSLSRIDAEHVGIVYEGSQAQLVFEKIPVCELLGDR